MLVSSISSFFFQQCLLSGSQTKYQVWTTFELSSSSRSTFSLDTSQFYLVVKGKVSQHSLALQLVFSCSNLLLLFFVQFQHMILHNEVFNSLPNNKF